MVKKAKESVKRDKGGRFKKGTPGGPGRKKGDPKDLICKNGKKRSVGVLLDDLLNAYASMGGEKFIKKWALESKGNLKKFIEILFKFAPQPQDVDHSGNITYEVSEQFMPKFKIERICTDIRPDEYERLIKEIPESGDARKKVIMKLQAELKRRDGGGTAKMVMPRPGDATDKRIKDMEDKLKEKDEELRRLKALINNQDAKELKHEPIPPIELPEHTKDSKKKKSKEESGKKSTFVTTGDFNREGKLKPDFLKDREQRKKDEESKGYR